ncbi:MAG: helix-turn-helix domain-containing protein [Crocinitomicaceae bacterium]|nr:helix-turn-helix domain-containing protein [Crocinitomicaceae bacterium]MCF8433218.1 helix-turn-helix domain-containing protein [Crocinitomicaceae bacterium]
METLGKTLKSAREGLSLTLREIETETGISNAYLSQLENEKIKKPSASILYKLAAAYKIELNDLLRAAGIITQRLEEKDEMSELEKEIAFYKSHLSEDEQRQVVTFMKFLKSQG